jgi:hypothetical protein
MLLIFILSIMFLIIRSNIISILLGWDGLGLSNRAAVVNCVLDRTSDEGPQILVV